MKVWLHCTFKLHHHPVSKIASLILKKEMKLSVYFPSLLLWVGAAYWGNY